MSYDISITESHSCHACDRTETSNDMDVNVTWNIRPMLDHIGITFQDLEVLDGITLANRIYSMLQLLKLAKNAGELDGLEPENGWGSSDDLIQTVAIMSKAAYNMVHPVMYLC
jgi:hypothetical protein